MTLHLKGPGSSHNGTGYALINNGHNFIIFSALRNHKSLSEKPKIGNNQLLIGKLWISHLILNQTKQIAPLLIANATL